MQDVERVPNPNLNTPDVDGGKERIDIEQVNKKNEPLPVPPDRQPAHPVEEPPDVQEKPPVDEGEDGPKKIV